MDIAHLTRLQGAEALNTERSTTYRLAIDELSVFETRLQPLIAEFDELPSKIETRSTFRSTPNCEVR